MSGCKVCYTVVMSGDDVYCSVVFGTLVGVFVFSVMWSELLMTSAISCPLWSSSPGLDQCLTQYLDTVVWVISYATTTVQQERL